MIIEFNPNEYITLESVFERISVAESFELADIVEVLLERYKEVFPDWEVQLLALPKEKEQQIEYLQKIIDVIQSLDW